MDSKYLYEQVSRMTAIPAPPGHEQKLASLLEKELQTLTSEVNVDRLNNVCGSFFGSQNSEKSIIVFAHMDEVALMVSKIEPNGFLRFERMGGIAEKTLPAQLVEVHTLTENRAVTGTVGTVSHHYASDDQKRSIPPRSQMYIDVGATCREDVISRGVDVGSTITYSHQSRLLNDCRIISKSLDNRLAIVALLEVAKLLSKSSPLITVHIVFSSQEEFSLRGVTPVFERLRPDYALCIDISPACDVPDLAEKNDISLGKGPVVTHMNSYGKGPFGGLIPNRFLRESLELIAKEKGIPFQREVISGVITDAAFIQYSGSFGVATAHLSIPVRYTHSPCEMGDLTDLSHCIDLIYSFAKYIE